MLRWAILGPDGTYPAQAGSGRTLPPGAIETPPDVLPETIAASRLVDGAWVPRPALPDPAVAGSADGLRVTVGGLPPEAACTVWDAATGEALATLTPDEGAIVFTLADPGRYLIEIEAPRPWRPVSRAVVVP